MLQSHPGDPRFQCRSETSRGALWGVGQGLQVPPACWPRVGAVLTCGRSRCSLGDHHWAGKKVLQGAGLRRQKLAYVILISELTVEEGYTWGPRNCFVLKGWPRTLGRGQELGLVRASGETSLTLFSLHPNSPAQPLAFLPPLTCHQRPPACYLRTGHKPEPAAAPRLSSAVESIWQKRGSQGRKEAESGGLTSRVPGPSLRINTAEARCPLHGEWSLRTRAWP